MKLPRYVHAFVDRHGKARFYLRRPGFKRIALSGLPYSPEFMTAYEAGMAGQAPPVEIAASRTLPGTVNALAISYYHSHQFTTLAESTKTTYRGIIERFREEHGDKRVALLQREHIVKLLNDKSSKPAAANNWLRMVRMLMQHAVETGLRRDDPTLHVKPVRIKSQGFETWSEEHIALFRAHHAIGTRARLALELLLGTIQRRSDVVRMGRQHIKDGILTIRQQKTGMPVDIPVLDELKEAIASLPSDHLTFLTTEAGNAFSVAGFGNLFRDWCNEAGLPKGLAAHGLRKAGATRLAEAGCNDHEIMAWGGWTTIKEVQRYTRAANRKKLGLSGAEKLRARTSIGKPE